ncbi:MAG TPA: hypothetical protein VJ739_00660, partial [Gemmataceae bacterium]|nr:hypothetical protein [Gemmataceae bacterium]
FGSFLARDLALPDDVALRWLEAWDRGNSPPKGRDRLAEILANVHLYGERAYGSGLDRPPECRPRGHDTIAFSFTVEVPR